MILGNSINHHSPMVIRTIIYPSAITRLAKAPCTNQSRGISEGVSDATKNKTPNKSAKGFRPVFSKICMSKNQLKPSLISVASSAMPVAGRPADL